MIGSPLFEIHAQGSEKAPCVFKAFSFLISPLNFFVKHGERY